jgi:hypothetical protein
VGIAMIIFGSGMAFFLGKPFIPAVHHRHRRLEQSAPGTIRPADQPPVSAGCCCGPNHGLVLSLHPLGALCAGSGG